MSPGIELGMFVLQARRRALGNIQFIGNLYQHRMLTEKIMHGCITELLTEVLPSHHAYLTRKSSSIRAQAFSCCDFAPTSKDCESLRSP